MIVLWVLSLIFLTSYTLVLASGKPSGEGMGALKWIVVATMLIAIFTMVWIGVRLWLKN